MAELPLRSESVADALFDTAEFARQRLISVGHSEISISVGERGARIHQLLAPLLPAESKEFYLESLRGGEPLTAAQFLEAAANTKPERTYSIITLNAAALPIHLRCTASSRTSSQQADVA